MGEFYIAVPISESGSKFPYCYAIKGKNGFMSADGRPPVPFPEKEAGKEAKRLTEEEGFQEWAIFIVEKKVK